MNKAKFISFASVISELQQSDLFMTVKARILETPKANLNGAAVTPAFVDDIIAHEDQYVGLPLYADIKALENGKYNRLGHLYDSKTGEFHSTQIGSFYQFEKEEFEGGAYLVGYARIPKRNKKLSSAIAELFADGALKFSFEIACSDYEELEDGTFLIDASENNYLEGTAIVTFPACEDAVALEFVAQREADDTERGEKEMAEVEKLEVAEVETEATETQPEETVTAQEAEQEPKAEVQAEETVNTEESAEPEQTEIQAETETATVYLTETHIEESHVSAYDTETGKEVSTSVEIVTRTSEPVEGNLVEVDEGMAVAEEGKPAETAETQVAEDTEVPGEPKDPDDSGDKAPEDVAQTPESDEKKKTAEEMIAELTDVVKQMAEEIKALKEQKIVAANEKLEVSAEIVNPFMDSMTTNGSKYDLLEPVEKPNGYSLLTR